MTGTTVRADNYQLITQAALGLETEDAARLLATEYQALAVQDEDERRHAVHAMVREEYRLSDDDLRAFMLARLSAWASMSTERARQTAEDYDAEMSRMPAAAAMRRVVNVQSVLSQMPDEDRERLRGFMSATVVGADVPKHRLDAQREPVRRSRRRWPISWIRDHPPRAQALEEPRTLSPTS